MAAARREHSTSQVRIHTDDNEPIFLELPVLQPSPDLSAFAYALTGSATHHDEAQPLTQPATTDNAGPAVRVAVQGHGGIDSPPVQITYRDIKFSVEVPQAKKEGGGMLTRTILKGCTGSFEPGRLTAIMGASGAGKTSLLNIISGNATKGKVEGSLQMNNLQLPLDEMARMREISAFIQQDDILIATMTVREYVTLSAKLRLPKSMPLAEKLERVERTIEILGLTKCANTIIGNTFNKGISGGEKRRVSMALELIKSPSVLFLDEPTSGLDTFTAFSIMGMLRDVAHEQGKTVVATIHQPSSDIWHCFDDLVLMAEGQIMYHGPAQKVVDYFDRAGYKCPSNFNPADHLFMKVLYNMEAQLALVAADMNYETQVVSSHVSHSKGAKIGHHSAEWIAEREKVSKAAYESSAKEEAERVASLLAAWNASPEQKALMRLVDQPLQSALPDPTAMRAERPGELYAFTLLSRRRWFDLLRDKMKLRVQFFQYLFFSLLIGTIFLRVGHDQNSVQDRQGCLFFISVQAMFMSFLSNLNTFGPEKVVMKREMESGLYGLRAYFFSRWIIEVPFRILFPFIYALILFFLVRFQTADEHFILAAIALILIDNCGTNMSIMICSMFPDVQQAMQAGPAFILPLMLFSGFYIQLHSIGWWFRWISYISPIRWGFVALIKNEMDGLTFSCPQPPLACAAPDGEAVVNLLGLDSEPSIALNLFIMLILLGGFLVGAFSFMWLTTKKR